MAGYIGSKASVVSSGAERKKVFDITATTTSLTGCSYTPNQVHVFHNGVRLVDGTDYTATDGSTVTLTTAAQSGDEVVVVSYATFQTSDTVSASAGGTFTGDVTFSGAFTSRGIDDNADAVAMTIDSSENVLVGKTSSSGDVVGHRLSPDGRLLSTVDGNYVAQFNRKTSDGNIAEFRKDGTTVGSIGNRFGAMYVHSPDGANGSGLRFYNGTIQPCESNGNDSDNDTNLGQSNSRFKNLYLSGGVYLGGTGAANYLDDYEEGTWTPTITASSSNPSITYAVQSGQYTKIGQMVNLHFYIRCTAFSGGSGDFRISGIPFSATSTSGFRAGNVSPYYRYITNNGASIVIYIYETASFLSLTKYSDADQWDTTVNVGEVTSGSLLIGGGISYITNA